MENNNTKKSSVGNKNDGALSAGRAAVKNTKTNTKNTTGKDAARTPQGTSAKSKDSDGAKSRSTTASQAQRRPDVKSDTQRKASRESVSAGRPDTPKLTREERLKLLREERERQNQKKRAFFEYVMSLATVFAITFVVAAILFCTVFFANLLAHKSPDTKSYSLLLSDYENNTEIDKGSVVGKDGMRYVNFSQIADFYGFAMVGSIDNMKYVLKQSENETIAFRPNSDKVLVNGVAVRSDGKAFYKNGDLYVSEGFINDYMLGFDVVRQDDKREVSFSRVLLNAVDADGKIVDGDEPRYRNIEFALKAPAVTASIAENDSAVVMPTFEFYTDMRAYEEYMNPGSTTEFLTLVNEQNKLSEDYIPTGLSLLKYGEGMYLKQYAAKSFEAMMKEAQACGITGLTVTRAYVSYSEALAAYNDVVDKYVNLLGNDQANRYAAATVALPGTDEHQTGLAVDLALTSGAEFSSSTAFAWLCDNSYKFGFVLRYPPNKSDATGSVYKPEQFRYVGRYHAVRMNALGLTLDEYSEYLGL